MLQLTEELKGAEDGEAEQVRERVSNLMTELGDGTLQHLVRFGGHTSQQKRFVLDANESLAVDSVVKVVTAAAASSEQKNGAEAAGQNGDPPSMTRGMARLGATPGHRPKARRRSKVAVPHPDAVKARNRSAAARKVSTRLQKAKRTTERPRSGTL
jgi:hypothetical protein